MAGYLDLMKAATPGGDIETRKAAPSLFQELGIYSPTEKLQLEQQSQQANFLLRQHLMAQAQQQQLALANSKAGAPQGLGFSQFLGMGGMQNIRQAERYGTQATQAAQGAMQNQMGPALPDYGGADPSKILNDALAKNPNDPGKAYRTAAVQFIQLGRMKGNPDLTNIGATLLKKAEEADKEAADLANKKASTEGTIASTAATKQKTDFEAAQASNPGDTYTYRQANGDITTARDKKDNKGRVVGKIIEGSGPNRQINEDGTPLTKTQFGDQYGKFGDLLKNSQTSLESMDDIANSLEAGAKVGWAEGVVTLLDNAVGTLEQLAPNAKLTARATQRLTEMDSKFEEIASKTGIAKSQIVDLTSSLAKTYNPTGTITEKDITRAAQVVAGNASSPKTMAAVLKDAARRTVRYVDTNYEYMDGEAQKASKAQYDHFKSKWGSQKKGDRTESRRGRVKSGPNAGKTIIEYSDGSKEYK